MPAMCDHAADGSEKGDTTIDDGIVQDRRGITAQKHPLILTFTIIAQSIPIYTKVVYDGMTDKAAYYIIASSAAYNQLPPQSPTLFIATVTLPSDASTVKLLYHYS
ncbi:unnamed protein product [Trichogramma brassicae]|uniref:Uncharacterized protein n=1 Tax=Trichogramma brassicae TaxID=86971 RepID=A0A6H5HYJ4_9HYME|nr:unnamed protein product [Trichogramma brassicae]